MEKDDSSETSDLFHPHRWFMRKALQLARKAADAGEVPVGAVIVHENRVIGQAWNQVEMLKDATAHAEMIAITQAASALGDWRLAETTLYVTKEPCPMCAGAIVLARIPTVVWGMTDPVRGGAISQFNILQHEALNHRVDCITGILEEECKEMMQGFFRKLREASRKRDLTEKLEGLELPDSDRQRN
ncbi:MAG TPA: tRNA adenosine(34) deaminase TadA [Kiritimatiellia bacterium]|nr:tRNA adenosine(34) deaminase TadA [Kiritimatiellia bacterium]